MEKFIKSDRKYNKEEQLFINPKSLKNFSNRKNKNKSIKILSILIIIMLLIILLTILSVFLLFKKKDNFKNKAVKAIKDPDFYKYQSMMPHLSPDPNDKPSSLESIFNARQIYISDVRITPDYIKYIRPINETEEEKYKKRYSENETIIDKNLFEKRPDQYDYKEFCKLSLEEKLIDNKTIEYDNKPIISIVVPSYNKQDFILKTTRSIQNQNFKNIEIIIVNDCSKDNSSIVYNYLLESDPRIRIFHHTVNLGLFRTRLDGILYSRGKYIISLEAGDVYEDNYVLTDAYNVMEKYNLDSCKFLFRVTRSFNSLDRSFIQFHIGSEAKIVYEPDNIKALNTKVFNNWGNIWNRLIRANIYIKGILLFNELILNVYKNMWDDIWHNEVLNKVSYSYAIFERVGLIYCQDGNGAGVPKFSTDEQKSSSIREYVGFLYFDYNFCGHNKTTIINRLKVYNEGQGNLRLQNFRSHFEVLNNLLEALIKDPDLIEDDKKYCEKLVKESKIRENEIDKINREIVK